MRGASIKEGLRSPPPASATGGHSRATDVAPTSPAGGHVSATLEWAVRQLLDVVQAGTLQADPGPSLVEQQGLLWGEGGPRPPGAVKRPQLFPQ
jgi:hypothetical protein